jgi:hypothetical protein
VIVGFGVEDYALAGLQRLAAKSGSA